MCVRKFTHTHTHTHTFPFTTVSSLHLSRSCVRSFWASTLICKSPKLKSCFWIAVVVKWVSVLGCGCNIDTRSGKWWLWMYTVLLTRWEVVVVNVYCTVLYWKWWLWMYTVLYWEVLVVNVYCTILRSGGCECILYWEMMAVNVYCTYWEVVVVIVYCTEKWWLWMYTVLTEKWWLWMYTVLLTHWEVVVVNVYCSSNSDIQRNGSCE